MEISGTEHMVMFPVYIHLSSAHLYNCWFHIAEIALIFAGHQCYISPFFILWRTPCLIQTYSTHLKELNSDEPDILAIRYTSAESS